jgi:DNA-binding transcriptional LysR family regulator
MKVPDIGLVAVFVKVVELEGFTAAATALGIPKSSVSRSVAQLEEGLNARLLQRTSRKLSLTDAGRAFYERVREPVGGVIDAMADAAESSRDPSGTIRFTAPSDLATEVLAGPIAEFTRDHPRIRLELILTNRVVDLVAERVDLALRATTKLDDSTLVARKIASPRTGLFAAKSYVERRGKPETLEELAEHDFVVFRPHGRESIFRLVGPQGEELVELQGTIAVDDFSFVRRAVEEGAGIGMLPAFGTRADLVRILPDYSTIGGSIYLVMPTGRQVPARVALFRDHLLAKLKSCNE